MEKKDIAMKEKYTSMISPTLETLQENGKYNRYELVIATAKCARMVTDEYVSQREHAEKLVANKETDKSIAALITPEYRDEKSVRVAINRLHKKEYEIDDNTLGLNVD